MMYPCGKRHSFGKSEKDTFATKWLPTFGVLSLQSFWGDSKDLLVSSNEPKPTSYALHVGASCFGAPQNDL